MSVTSHSAPATCDQSSAALSLQGRSVKFSATLDMAVILPRRDLITAVRTALSLLPSSDILDAARADVFSAKSSLASARSAGDKTAVKTAVKTVKAAKAKVRSILRHVVWTVLIHDFKVLAV